MTDSLSKASESPPSAAEYCRRDRDRYHRAYLRALRLEGREPPSEGICAGRCGKLPDITNGYPPDWVWDGPDGVGWWCPDCAGTR